MTEREGQSTIETSPSKGKTPEQARREKGIKPISQDEVDERVERQHTKIKINQENYSSYDRGVEEYLEDESTYAILPAYKGISAKLRIAGLKPGSKILDIACGTGRCLQEVEKGKPPSMKPVNTRIEGHGYDAVKREGEMQIDDNHFIEGKLNDLSPETYRGMRFPLVTNVATSYHATNFFGVGLQAMTSMLEKDGLLLISSLPLAARMDFYDVADKYRKNNPPETIIEDTNGEIMKGIPKPSPTDSEGNNYLRSQEVWAKGRCAGVFRPDGSLVTPKDYFSFLQRESGDGFNFEYSVGNSLYITHNGKLAVEKLREDAELNLKNVFYAKMKREEMLKSPYYSRLCYIIAETTDQAEELSANGFVSVGAVDRETRVLKIIKEGVIGKTREEIDASRYSRATIAKLRAEGVIPEF